MKLLKYGFLLIVALIVGVALYLHKDVTKEHQYVSSENCQDCHETYYQGWKSTLHPKMFRPVTSPDDIQGDFSLNDPAVTFKKEDIQYVVGNKWEQVYVRMIDDEYYPFPAKWFISTQKWVPYKVKDWHETPMSTKCNGCHTTGFNQNTHEFNEYGIGCEACHGPGSIHVQNQKMKEKPACTICHEVKEINTLDIISKVDSSVCGQCHSRGTNIPYENKEEKGKFNFPVGIKPGDNLDTAFKPLTQQDDKKKKYWWGNGVSKNRHQEFADWNNSKHSKSLKLLLEKESPERGELKDECLECHSTDYRFAKEGQKPNLKTAKYGVTCVACHDPHGFDKKLSLMQKGTFVCGGCHIDSMSFKAQSSGRKSHYPCPPSSVSCADCHMPYIVTTGGDFTLRSHAFKVINPKDSKEYGLPNSCQNGGCHQDKSIEWAIEEFNEFYQKE